MAAAMAFPLLDAADPCKGCGACCRHMVMPPFVPDFADPRLRNDEFDAFRASWPDLADELEAEYARKMGEDDWPEEAPCFWYDAAARRCKHHDARPQICRDFGPGSEECGEAREREGIDPCPAPST